MLLLAMIGCKEKQTKIEGVTYPETCRDEVVDNYFGVQVADPYRWLEDDNSEDTAEWVKAQNSVTQSYLAKIPFREAIKSRLTQLYNYPKIGMPSKHGDYYYYFKNDGLQNQSVLYRSPIDSNDEMVVLDPNSLSDDGTVALSSVSFSKDGAYMAYAVSASGSDWVEINVMDCATLETKIDNIKWVKFSGASWSADNQGFYYSRYDEPKEGVFSSQNKYQKVYYHKLDDHQDLDKRIFMDAANPLRYFSANESRDGNWVFVTASEGTSGNEILFRRKGSTRGFNVLLEGFKYDYSLVYAADDFAYVLTNDGAQNYRLVKINLLSPEQGIQDVIAESENVLNSVSAVGGYFIATYLENAQSIAYQHYLTGERLRQVELPLIGTLSGFGGEREDTETFYAVNSYTSPASIYKYDLASGTSELYRKPELPFNPDDFATEQVFFNSKDCTRQPMFLTSGRCLKRAGKNPL